MTIDEVYRFIQFIANKDQRGFIKPSEFNLAATRAQLDVIEIKQVLPYILGSQKWNENIS